MDITLWILQVLLALLFTVAGSRKLLLSRELLIERQPWAAGVSTPGLRAIGTLELLGAAGLILPGATGIAPLLTPLAASGLVLTMVCATALHVRRHEFGAVAFTATLFVIAAIIVAGQI